MGRWAMWGPGAAMLLSAAAAGPAAAGDYVSRCTSADGTLVMRHDKLFNELDGGRELDYDILKKTMLEEQIGYCESGSETFPFAGEHTVLTVRVKLGPGGRVVHLICETLADGLPASESCAREVVTSRSGIHSEY